MYASLYGASPTIAQRRSVESPANASTRWCAQFSGTSRPTKST